MLGTIHTLLIFPPFYPGFVERFVTGHIFQNLTLELVFSVEASVSFLMKYISADMSNAPISSPTTTNQLTLW